MEACTEDSELKNLLQVKNIQTKIIQALFWNNFFCGALIEHIKLHRWQLEKINPNIHSFWQKHLCRQHKFFLQVKTALQWREEGLRSDQKKTFGKHMKYVLCAHKGGIQIIKMEIFNGN